MTLKLIKADGTLFELGFQIGTAVRGTVHKISIQNSEFTAAEDKWIGSDYIRQMMQLTEKVYPEFTQELRGMAEGMNIDYERAFIWNCRGDLRWPDDISAKMAAELSEGCTSLLLPRSTTGHPVVAHNEDGSADYADHCFWLQASPAQGPAFESFLYPGMIAGHSMGANAAGVVQTINNIRVHDLKIGIPRHFICRAVLASPTLEVALSHIERSDRASGFHHNLGDAISGRLLSVEAPASACILKEITERPSAHANHLVFDEIKALDQSITHSSQVRQIRSNDLLQDRKNSPVDPLSILRESQPGSEILRRPSDGGDDYGQTLATGVFALSPSEIKIDVHHSYNSADILHRTIQIQ